jgi:hypothetical protein
MNKLLIVSSAALVGILCTVPLVMDKYISSKVIERIEVAKAQMLKIEPSLSIDYGDVRYNVFDDLVTIKDLHYSSESSGLDLSIDKSVYTLINEKGNWEDLTSIPDYMVTSIEGGKLNLKEAEVTQKEKDIVSFIAGGDNTIDFSMKMSVEFDKKHKEYNYYSDFYLENIGTYDLSFVISGLDPYSGKLKSLKQSELVKYIMTNVGINNFNLSLTTQNVKGITDELFLLKNYVNNDDEFIDELEKVASRMDSEESMSGFSKPIRDFSKSYISNKEMTISLSSNKDVKINDLVMAFTTLQVGSASPLAMADHLGIKITSNVK